VGLRYRSSAKVDKEGNMHLVKRIVIAVGSLFALAIAGGAHLKF
jgi:hypothetical protein